MSTRGLFTDGWNSFAHFAFGYLAVTIPPILPLFAIYQLKDVTTDPNTPVDILEFGIGYVVKTYHLELIPFLPP